MLILSTLTLSDRAGASPVDDKRREAERIANQIEALESTAFDVGEEYARTESQLAQVSAQVTTAQKQVAALEAQVSSMRTAIHGFAVQSYIYGVQGTGVTALIGGGDAPVLAAQRDLYTELVLGSSVSKVDELETITQDAARQRQDLEAKQARQRSLQTSLAQKKEQIAASLQKAQSLQAKVKGQLATLVAQEQARKAQEAAAKARAQQPTAAAPTRSAAATRSQASRPAAAAPAAPAAPSGPRPGANVPPPSPGAGGAVAAALSQQGVPYRYASASPGVAFDCSGLTAWAWEQAGVSLPHQSRSQYAALPHVGQDQIQPGDLVFYYSPIGHVAMYIGNGQLVHATSPGDVVKVGAVNWGKVVGIARPG